MIKDSIALIGFMATGKSTVGEALAKYLGGDYKFYEIDEIVTRMAGKPISQIFNEEGEHVFRQFEIRAIKKISKYKKSIISCGGGAVLNQVNIKRLKQNCHIVLLKATIEEISKRIMKDGKKTRPVIDKDNLQIEIENVLLSREKFYNMAAEFIIDTTHKSINEIIHEVLSKTKVNK